MRTCVALARLGGMLGLLASCTATIEGGGDASGSPVATGVSRTGPSTGGSSATGGSVMGSGGSVTGGTGGTPAGAGGSVATGGTNGIPEPTPEGDLPYALPAA